MPPSAALCQVTVGVPDCFFAVFCAQPSKPVNEVISSDFFTTHESLSNPVGLGVGVLLAQPSRHAKGGSNIGLLSFAAMKLDRISVHYSNIRKLERKQFVQDDQL
jgi:hypothetical protein